MGPSPGPSLKNLDIFIFLTLFTPSQNISTISSHSVFVKDTDSKYIEKFKSGLAYSLV